MSRMSRAVATAPATTPATPSRATRRAHVARHAAEVDPTRAVRVIRDGALIAMTAAALVLAPAAACAREDALTPAAHGATVHTGPEEDQPGWNCAEMGNRQCGPFDPADPAANPETAADYR